MENPHIIYEKKFPHSKDEYEAIFAEKNPETGDEIPDRIENQGFFIAQAKEITEQNEIDTTITEYEDKLIAEFRIGDDSPNFGIKGIIGYADDVCFGCVEGEVVLSVIYYTHAT